MSKFRELVENILIEAKVIRAEKPWRKGEYFSILKNPSKMDVKQFKSNTKFNAIRGIIYEDDIYIADAFIGIHDNLMDGVASSLGYDRWQDNLHWEAAFEIDDFDNLSVRGTTNSTFDKIFNDYNKEGNYNLSNGPTYFDKENEGLDLDPLKEYDREDPHDQYWNRSWNNKPKFKNEEPEIRAGKTRTIPEEEQYYIKTTCIDSKTGYPLMVTYKSERSPIGRTFDKQKASLYNINSAQKYIEENPEYTENNQTIINTLEKK